MAAHLYEADPGLRVVVLDHSDEWMLNWMEHFRRAEIKHLRSPMVHHPWADPYALKRFVDVHGLARSGLPYDVPMADVFIRFCRALVEHAQLEPPRAVTPQSIRSDGRSIDIETAQGSITARHLVVATNPHQRVIPRWVDPLLGRQVGLVAYGLDVDLGALGDLSGRQIAIIGGGLTAAHLAVGAARRGAMVRLISRRNLSIRSFDTAPGWLGPKYLDAFDAEPDPQRRLQMAVQARSGGSIPQWMFERLSECSGDGQIDVLESTVVRSAEPDPAGGCTLALSTGPAHADHVWLATGTLPDAHALKCLHPLLADVPMLQGLPIIDERLRLGPHPAFVMGRLATLALGPASGNLWGAQRAAERITTSITGVDLDAVPIRPMGSISTF